MTTRIRETASITNSQRDRLKDELIYRSWKDEAFRQELIANPAAVLEREYPEAFPNGKIPENLTVKIVTEEKNSLCIVLPEKPDMLNKSEFLDKGEEYGYCGTQTLGNHNTSAKTCCHNSIVC